MNIFSKVTPPFFKIFLVFWFIRFAMGVGTYIFEFMGDLTPPFSEFFWTQIWQLGEVLILFSGFFLLNKFKNLKFIVHIFLYPLIAGLIFWAIADPIIFSMAGDHLTPSLLAHFAGIRILFSPDLWEPIKEYAVLVIIGLSAVFSLLFYLYRLFKQSYQEDFSIFTSKSKIVVGVIGITLMFMPKAFGMSYLSYPAEILYMRDHYGWNRYFPEEEDIERIRNTFNKSIEKDWISDEYPLLHTNKNTKVNSTKPDIFLFVIESFRAKNSRIYNQTTGKLIFPELEKIAQNGVKFPFFISNGFPSSEGFFSLITGTWPHSRRRIAQNYRNTEFDNVATHLNNLGYKTVRMDYNSKIYKIDYWIKKYYTEGFAFIDTEVFPSDKNMLDSTIQFIKNHDNAHAPQPLFYHYKTKAPHYPYDFPNDSTETYIDLGTPSKNYEIGMTYVDKQLGRFYDYLLTRSRANNTILIVIGDHANYLDKSSKTSLPIDDVLWTGATINGPENLIGSPRTDNSHCSQIDIMPTILYLAGDSTARVSIGRNLLDKNFDDSDAFSIAVRPAGIRIDQGGFTHIVDRRHPSQFIKFPAFEGLMSKSQFKGLEHSSEDYLRIADSWSYLIEENKVYPQIKSLDINK